jgi:hypothetical protein
MEFEQTVPFIVNSNTQYLTLPFDTEWTDLIASADRFKGTMLAGTLAVKRERCAAGLDLFLSTSEPVITYLRALMPIDSSIGHVIFDHGFAGSSGGVGILVYETNSGHIVFDRRKQLWNEGLWMASMTTKQEEERYWLSQTNLAEISFGMSPGKKYLVWYWIWIILRTEGSGNVIASGSISAKLPLIILNTTPPIILK